MRRFIYSIIFMLPLLVLGGCDLLMGEDDGTIVVTGTVVLAETGEPLAGLGVSLTRSLNGPGAFLEETAWTGPDGRFRLRHEARSTGLAFTLTVNDEPYDNRYTLVRSRLRSGDDLALGTVRLSLRDGE